ncbi:Ves allergen [Trema orientale]|uniref:Ves allergen n=1 Tax=Trema orientale TaxID=63057 RepID=A0A2P5FJK1_TREOI|nr:Ves allergen [Trema orientale]
MSKLQSTITITTIFLLLTTISASKPRLPNVARYGLSQADQFLVPQNAVRAALRVSPLVWDRRLKGYAQWYANQRRYDCALVHSNGPYGENIFWGSGTGWTPLQAVSAWVDERKWYRYVSNSCAGGQVCGHYTQIVWRETRRIGCARVTCVDGKGVFMICNYDPPGNYYGEKPY